MLCSCDLESRDHNFFACSFSKQVWQMVLQLCGIGRISKDWVEEVCWAVAKIKGKSLPYKILKCAWCSYIFFIWRNVIIDFMVLMLLQSFKLLIVLNLLLDI